MVNDGGTSVNPRALPSPAQAIATGNSDVAAVSPSTNPINFSADEGQRYSGPVATFSQFEGSPLVLFPSSNYLAYINWGDGSPSTQGTIVPDGDGYQVTGIHTYSSARVAVGSSQFPVHVTIVGPGDTSTIVSSMATVSAVPIVLTGQLDRASDSGESNTDGITSDNQPGFSGSSKPFSTVSLFAQPTAGGSPILFGSTQANGAARGP